MRANEFLIEADPALKKQIIGIVKQTEDDELLHRVLSTLNSSNLNTRLYAALKTDKDAGHIVDAVASIITNANGTHAEKDAFIKQFSEKFINTSVLFSGSRVSYADFVQEGFPLRVFADMVVAPALRPQGVGPGELALAIMSKHIHFTGQSQTAGDISVDGVGHVEVKASVKSGGRWINPRKARINVEAIRAALEKTLDIQIPDRVSISNWAAPGGIREQILHQKQQDLKPIARIIGKGLFHHVDSSNFQKALVSGTAEDINQWYLSTGFENYKTYSGFTGLLMLDTNAQTAHYFADYEHMAGFIKAGVAYVLAPDGECMPKVLLVA